MLDLILILCGLVMLLAAMLVLHVSHAAELSMRSVSALLIGAGGAWCIARAFLGPPAALPDLLLPLGVAIWIAGALWRGLAWAAPAAGGVMRAPWAGPGQKE